MLISTSVIRTWMEGNIADGDKTPNNKLYALSNSIQDFADSYTGRKLEAAIYNSDPDQSYYDGNRRRWIYAKQYPISYLENIWLDADRTFDDSTLLTRNDLYVYPASGKIFSEAGSFQRGHRNIKISYKAGYAPVLGGTHDSAVSTYPLPQDLEQVMVEMIVEALKTGMTAIQTVEGETFSGFRNLLTQNSFWKITLDKYKKYDNGLGVLEDG